MPHGCITLIQIVLGGDSRLLLCMVALQMDEILVPQVRSDVLAVIVESKISLMNQTHIYVVVNIQVI